MKPKTIEEKVVYVSNKINNMHESKHSELIKFVEDNPNTTGVNLLYLFRKGWGSHSSHSPQYWINRGWPEGQAVIKSSKSLKVGKKVTLSPFARDFYLEKINPETGKVYTEEEADFKRNSYRPIRKEYWMAKGFGEEESIELAVKTKIENNNKGGKRATEKESHELRETSPRCKEYYLNRGYGLEEAELLLSKAQSTFSLQKCIEKHGAEEGYSVWQKRQDDWQNTLNSKSEEEIKEINRSKRVSYNRNGMEELNLYLINISYPKFDKIYYKIGITTRTLKQRFASHIRYGGTIEEILFKPLLSEEAIRLESMILLEFNHALQKDHTIDGYTECFDSTLITKQDLINYITQNASNN